MRKIAFGYSTRCNIKCEHCVAAGDQATAKKMALSTAKKKITDLALANVSGVSFSAGEPFLYFDDMNELINICHKMKIYTRIVTNSFWAKSTKEANRLISELKTNGLCQLRLSYSRWHQKNIPQNNVLNAAASCKHHDLSYFISFVTDFSRADDKYEQFLRENNLLFFPEPVIYAGRAESFKRRTIQTDYQENCCNMNPYITPTQDMYACCDAGSHFSETGFFYLGNLKDHTAEQLFCKSEHNSLHNLIRNMGITNIASYCGMKAREIISYSKCELCRKLFNSAETLQKLRTELPQLAKWSR